MGKPGQEPRTNRQLRFAILGQKKAARLYSASDIQLIQPDNLGEISYLARLGPVPINQRVLADDLIAVFKSKRFRGRSLGGLLLDQGFVAGIGNYLRSEILFEADRAPATRPRDLDDTGRKRLAASILNLIHLAYKLKGITERAEALKKAGWTFSRRWHMVFNRDSEACHQCGTGIMKTVIASRRFYYCPSCQDC